jgi:putative flippase GtrA
MTPARSGRLAELLRFLAAGIGNTLATVAIYQLAVGHLGPLGAYVLAWTVGILLVVTLYPRLVFRRAGSPRNGATMGAVYLVAFLLGLIVTALGERAGLHPRAIIFLSAAVTAAFSYLCGRTLLR